MTEQEGKSNMTKSFLKDFSISCKSIILKPRLDLASNLKETVILINVLVFQEKSKAFECYYPHFKVSGKVMNKALPDKE